MLVQTVDTVYEWLRSWTRNPMGSARKGSNPFGVGEQGPRTGNLEEACKRMRRLSKQRGGDLLVFCETVSLAQRKELDAVGALAQPGMMEAWNAL